MLLAFCRSGSYATFDGHSSAVVTPFIDLRQSSVSICVWARLEDGFPYDEYFHPIIAQLKVVDETVGLSSDAPANVWFGLSGPYFQFGTGQYYNGFITAFFSNPSYTWHHFCFQVSVLLYPFCTYSADLSWWIVAVSDAVVRVGGRYIGHDCPVRLCVRFRCWSVGSWPCSAEFVGRTSISLSRFVERLDGVASIPVAAGNSGCVQWGNS